MTANRDDGWKRLENRHEEMKQKKGLIKKEAQSAEIADLRWGDKQPYDEERCWEEVAQWGGRQSISTIMVGRYLLWIRSRSVHGEFEKQLGHRTDIPPRTAYYLMDNASRIKPSELEAMAGIGLRRVNDFLNLSDADREAIVKKFEDGKEIGIPPNKLRKLTRDDLETRYSKLSARNRDLEKEATRLREQMKENEKKYVVRDAAEPSSPFEMICRKLDILQRETLALLRSYKSVEDRRKDAEWIGVRLTSWANMVGQVGMIGEMVPFPFPKKDGEPADEPDDEL